MEVRWSDNAVKMADEVLDYTFEMFGERQTAKISNRFVAATEQLEQMPYSGQLELSLEGKLHQYRYLLVNPHLKLLYYVEDDIVYIAAVWNVRQSEKTIMSRITPGD